MSERELIRRGFRIKLEYQGKSIVIKHPKDIETMEKRFFKGNQTTIIHLKGN